jgi:hypothetical protein
MLKVTFQVIGMADLMVSRYLLDKKQDGETYEQFEERIWKKKLWVNPEGQCYLNSFCVTNSLLSAAKWLGRKVEGRTTFASRFVKGISPGSSVLLFKPDGSPMTVEDVDPIPLPVPSDGKHGGTKRVPRIFPTFHQWVAHGDFDVFDGKITPDQIHDHLRCVGQFIGWGAMRVENGGINGRFRIDKLDFQTDE